MELVKVYHVRKRDPDKKYDVKICCFATKELAEQFASKDPSIYYIEEETLVW